jgi:hypothetical protein
MLVVVIKGSQFTNPGGYYQGMIFIFSERIGFWLFSDDQIEVVKRGELAMLSYYSSINKTSK